MAEDTKDVRNQPPASESPYSESQVERGSDPSNATKQPGHSREHQGGQGSPTKSVKKGDEQNQEN